MKWAILRAVCSDCSAGRDCSTFLHKGSRRPFSNLISTQVLLRTFNIHGGLTLARYFVQGTRCEAVTYQPCQSREQREGLLSVLL